MGNFEEALLKAMAKRIERQSGRTNITVIGYSDPIHNSGCSTCGYGESYELHIYYNSSEGYESYVYKGSFSDLMQELTIE